MANTEQASAISAASDEQEEQASGATLGMTPKDITIENLRAELKRAESKIGFAHKYLDSFGVPSGDNIGAFTVEHRIELLVEARIAELKAEQRRLDSEFTEWRYHANIREDRLKNEIDGLKDDYRAVDASNGRLCAERDEARRQLEEARNDLVSDGHRFASILDDARAIAAAIAVGGGGAIVDTLWAGNATAYERAQNIIAMATMDTPADEPGESRLACTNCHGTGTADSCPWCDHKINGGPKPKQDRPSAHQSQASESRYRCMKCGASADPAVLPAWCHKCHGGIVDTFDIETDAHKPAPQPATVTPPRRLLDEAHELVTDVIGALEATPDEMWPTIYSQPDGADCWPLKTEIVSNLRRLFHMLSRLESRADSDGEG